MTFEEFYKERFLDYYLEFAYEANQRFIEKYLREFTKEFKMRGYDDETIRRIILGDLFERGFDREQVDFVIDVDEVEWEEAKEGRVRNWKFIEGFRDMVKSITEDFFVKFRKNHPDFFEPSAEE